MLDLNQSPYDLYNDLLADLRANPSGWDTLAYRSVREERRGTHDANEEERARLIHVLSVQCTAADLELCRYLMDQEVQARRTDSFQGAGDALTMLSMMLLAHSDDHAADTWRFWSAKRANFDTYAGGYDIEFVYSLLSPPEVEEAIESRGTALDLEMIKERDGTVIAADLAPWKKRLARVHPTSLQGFTGQHCEAWALRFGDEAGILRWGLEGAPGPAARARVYREVERYADSVREWRAAAAEATSEWDEASRLTSAVTDAAKAGIDGLEDVKRLDALRSHIEGWSGVGLGRMATEACYRLAAATEGGHGSHLWNLAQSWRRELDSYTLVGLEAALQAAQVHGSAADESQLEAEAHAERTRIEQMLS